MLGRGRTSDHSDTDISDQEMDTARTTLSVSPYKDSGYRCDDYSNYRKISITPLVSTDNYF